MANVITVNDGNFEDEILRNDKPSVVLFKTEGCPYCRAMVPVMEQVANDMGERLKVAFIDAL